jgi:hypothetical protein
MRLSLLYRQRYGQPLASRRRSAMAEPKTPSDVRTLAVRVTPDFHAQLSMVAQVDEVSLTDLMMTALQTTWPHVATPRTSRRRSRPLWLRQRPRWPEPRPCCSVPCPRVPPMRQVLRQALTLRLRVGAGARRRLPADGWRLIQRMGWKASKSGRLPPHPKLWSLAMRLGTLHGNMSRNEPGTLGYVF